MMRARTQSSLTLWGIALSLLLASSVSAADGKSVAPFLDERTVAVLRLDLGKLDIADLLDRLGATAKLDKEALAGTKKEWSAWLKELTAAGGREMYVIGSLAEVPDHPPFVVLPLARDADAKALSAALPRIGLFDRSCTVERMGEALVLGSPDARKRLRTHKPVARPDIQSALVGAGAARLVLVPTLDTARILEETMPVLPEELGGGPVKPLSRGLKSVTVDLDMPPKLQLRLEVRAADAGSAQAIEEILQKGVKTLSESKAVREWLPEAGKLPALWKPRRVEDRLVQTLDEKALAQAGGSFIGWTVEAERRARAGAQMRRLLEALLDYHDRNGTFPPWASLDKGGKPLLSWRVHLLPYLGEEALYRQFKLDEAWDSPHNKKLIAKMPAVYRPAISKGLIPTHTTFLAPLGAATMFPQAGGLRVADVIDGTISTIMLADVRISKAVIWTRPADLKYDAKDPFRDLARRHGGQIMVGMVDGTVHFLPSTIEKATMAALFTRNGGEVVDIP
jgi:hypothetical protein